MATLHFCTSPPFTIFKQRQPNKLSAFYPKPSKLNSRRSSSTVIRAYKVVIEHEGKNTTLDVDPDESILERALDNGLSVPHDCKLGVCMTCPARLLSGSVDQSDGMLSDDVVEQGYTLLCVAYPRSDCQVKIIPEEELLSLQLVTSDD
ncbi:Ferredoxin c 1 protein [Thalictrum thalictroides]|uniref:Ferredoxin n=1 Tax=Thalictrum thalictroides TaxID=46969 RepID=A0A7J6WMR7_THATH|nr:Ferredoxin c 1 protein [Thalictrum thalictroides]